MFKYKYKVENIKNNIIIGSIENISKLTNKTPYDTFIDIYNLNTQAQVNIKNSLGKYVSRCIWIFSKDEKKFLIFKFKAYFFREKKALRKFFFQYSCNFYILIPMMLIEIVIRFNFSIKQFLIASLFNILIFFSIFIHETGHFLTACYFNLECAYIISDFDYSVIYKTESNVESIWISLMGPLSNLIIVLILVIFKIFITNTVLNMMCDLSIFINLIIVMNILPFFKDGNNVRKGLKILKKKKEKTI